MTRARWLLLAIVLVACSEQSRVDRDAQITISGTVLEPDSTPLADRPVRLGSGIGDGDVALAILTVGLSCTSGSCTGNVFDATTDGEGRYQLELKGSDTQSGVGEALSELLSASAAPTGQQVSGAAISARFKVQVEDVRVPALRLVDPALTVDGAEAVVARWSTSAPGPYELTFETDEPVALWQVTTATGEATIDPRVLEDTSGRVVVAAGFEDEIEGSDLAVRWRSPGVGYAAGAGPPPSRGRPCRYVDAAGTTGPADAGCGLTDGNLVVEDAASSICPPATDEAATTTACTAPVAGIVDLGGAVPAELIVVRGCPGGCAVDVSADGTTFRPVGAVADGYGIVELDGQPVTAVRVGLGTGTTGALREVSVWGPRPTTAALEPAADAPARGLFDIGDDGGAPLWSIVVACALAAAVLASIGFVVGRRRS
jgi:hypothetical protein